MFPSFGHGNQHLCSQSKRKPSVSHCLTIEAILTDNGTGFKGRPTIHLYDIFLDFNEIEHRNTKVGRPRTNGFVERFSRTVLDEFFRKGFRERFYKSVDVLHEDLGVVPGGQVVGRMPGHCRSGRIRRVHVPVPGRQPGVGQSS
ncbi:MAG: DDE-type integrase/transposase/recombinase [Proteobacteria bacterium]|nr:DDE-type integrase/transposase/recombinase [Pseudomonadota bacterium]